jgi:uncharacterized membrane protein
MKIIYTIDKIFGTESFLPMGSFFDFPHTSTSLHMRAQLWIFRSVLFWSLFLYAISPGETSLRICNQTGGQIGAAIGYLEKESWISEGWWNINEKECALAIAGPLTTRYYYIYATDYDNGGEWNGDAPMCIKDVSFRITGVKDCLSRGYKRAYFFEVDTRNQKDWSVQLTDKTRSSHSSSEFLSSSP